MADGLRDDADVFDVLTEILDAEQVRFLAALRYKNSGTRKRVRWEKTLRLAM